MARFAGLCVFLCASTAMVANGSPVLLGPVPTSPGVNELKVTILGNQWTTTATTTLELVGAAVPGDADHLTGTLAVSGFTFRTGDIEIEALDGETSRGRLTLSGLQLTLSPGGVPMSSYFGSLPLPFFSAGIIGQIPQPLIEMTGQTLAIDGGTLAGVIDGGHYSVDYGATPLEFQDNFPDNDVIFGSIERVFEFVGPIDTTLKFNPTYFVIDTAEIPFAIRYEANITLSTAVPESSSLLLLGLAASFVTGNRLRRVPGPLRLI